MDCYACDQRAIKRCFRCGKSYCGDHGDDPAAGSGQGLCADCLDPVSATPSSAVFRASLLALLAGSVLALWLLVRPPALPGEGSEAVQPVPTTVPSEEPGLSPTAEPGSPTAEPTTTPEPEPTATPTPEPTPEGPIEYTVVDGDTLYGIASAWGISAEDLAAVNGLDINDPIIQPGEVLIIPQ